jgi:ATP-dependent Lhr-like helicase
VSRDWWKREHPDVGWQDIYHELKRLEFRGEVQRGYFVTGLAGAQFALPEAVELLRSESGTNADAPVVLVPSDPANVYNLFLAGDVERDPLGRPRGSGAMLVTVRGRVIIASERRGGRLRVNESATSDEVRDAALALGGRLVGRVGGVRRRDVVVETIDGVRSAGSRWVEAFVEAGYRGMGTGLRYFAGV